MFRKLVSSLPFSPALVGQLGFYARRLKREQVTRRIGLILTVMALVVQSLAIITPPDQALASSASDIIPGGVSSVNDVLNVYDSSSQGKNDLKDLMDYFGVTRTELAGMRLEKTCSKDRSIVSFGRQHIFSAAEGELVHHVPTQRGVSTFYSTPLYLHDKFNGGSFCTDSFVGNSAKIGWFSVMKKCGNFQIKQDVRRLPKANFIAASCKTIQGFAYDERQLGQTVKVYLFFDGPPGKGAQYGPIIANQQLPNSPAGQGHGFSFAVPEAYQKKNEKTVVWGVMQPLAGWTEPNVQMENTVMIPGNCTPQATPIADCSSLKVHIIERTKFTLSATSNVENGATISGYHYRVLDQKGKPIYDKVYPTSDIKNTTDAFEVKTAGTYSAQVTATTSLGEKTNANCTQPLTVASPEKCKFNGSIDANNKDCQPCPYNPTLWAQDNDCARKIVQSKEAKNITRGTDGASTIAKPGDRIEYTLHTTNIGDVPITTNIEEGLSDVLEYGMLFENGGGKFNNDSKTLTWENINLKPGQVESRRLVVQIADVIPTTPRAGNNLSSYNCILTNAYGNTINIRVDCPLGKTIENTVQQLPSTGPGENILFGTALLVTVTYFYARSRQMNKEVRLLRKEFNGGTIN